MHYSRQLHMPTSELVKFRGRTRQIDVQSTILSIVSKYPGLIRARIADMIYDKTKLPQSHGYVYKVVDLLERRTHLVKDSEGQVYLTKDMLAHNQNTVLHTAAELSEIGVPLQVASFLTSGALMALELKESGKEMDEVDLDYLDANNIIDGPLYDEDGFPYIGYEPQEEVEMIEGSDESSEYDASIEAYFDKYFIEGEQPKQIETQESTLQDEVDQEVVARFYEFDGPRNPSYDGTDD